MDNYQITGYFELILMNMRAFQIDIGRSTRKRQSAAVNRRGVETGCPSTSAGGGVPTIEQRF
jgi:hypothetical protein